MLYPVLEHTLNGLKQKAIADLMKTSKASVSVHLRTECSAIMNHPANAKLRSALIKHSGAFAVRSHVELWTAALANATDTAPKIVKVTKSDNAVATNLRDVTILQNLALKYVKDPKAIFNMAYELGRNYAINE